MTMLVSLIAAVAQNGTIGRHNDLPWKLGTDMRFFVATTKGHTVITGRKNFEAMGRALPRRRNIVLSKSADGFEGAELARDIESSLKMADTGSESETFIIGGAHVYAAAMSYAHRFYRTLVLADVEGDVKFPAFDFSVWTKTELFRHDADDENEHPFIVERWDRSSAPRSYGK